MKKAIQGGCPETTHVVDYFHVIQLFTDVLERCRKYVDKGGQETRKCSLRLPVIELMPREVDGGRTSNHRRMV
ncbi:transposase [Geobacillus sp. PA-3]|uniref:transposase n=1 Tax=Geobacillus sp. PA-3 TaxID=1699078 RepID=UPI000AC597FB|nr:transposase [Geobacillus sp. PA-3]